MVLRTSGGAPEPQGSFGMISASLCGLPIRQRFACPSLPFLHVRWLLLYVTVRLWCQGQDLGDSAGDLASQHCGVFAWDPGWSPKLIILPNDQSPTCSLYLSIVTFAPKLCSRTLIAQTGYCLYHVGQFVCVCERLPPYPERQTDGPCGNVSWHG